MTRNVKLFYQQTGTTRDVESSAKTLAELKQDVGDSFTDKKLVVRETLNTIEMDDAELPTGNFTLYIVPQKSKAGGELDRYTYDMVSAMAGNNLRRAIRRLNKKGVTAIDEGLSTEEQRDAFIGLILGKKTKPVKTEKAPVKAEAPVKEEKANTVKAEKVEIKSSPESETTGKFTVKRKEAGGDVHVYVGGKEVDTTEITDKLDEIKTRLESIYEKIEKVGDTVKEAVMEAISDKVVEEDLQELKREADEIAALLGRN